MILLPNKTSTKSLIYSIPDVSYFPENKKWLDHRNEGDVMNCLYFYNIYTRDISYMVRLESRRIFQLNVWQEMNNHVLSQLCNNKS